MLPTTAMLATKNRAGRSSILFLMLAVLIAGCTPPGPRALLEGRRLLEKGQYPQAIEQLKLATSLLSTNAQAWNYLGVAYHRTGQPTNAAMAYQKALALNRNLIEARYNLGCLWLDESERDPAKAKLLDAARSEFTAYTLRRGNAVEGWLKLGTAQLRGREASAAEKSFREALRVDPKSAEACNGMGLVQLLRSRPREAAQWFSYALQHQSDYRPALLNLATVLHQQLSDRPGAIRKYREYLALQPRPADAETVAAIVETLEQPPLVAALPPATNTIPRAPAVGPAPKVTTTAVARVSAPVKTSPPPAITKTAPPPPPVSNAPVEVVRLPPETVIKTTPDAVASNPPAPTPSPTVEPAPSPPTRTTPVESPKQSKPGFFSRINPVNLFKGEPKSSPRTTPLPGDQAASANEPARSTASEPGKSVDSRPRAEVGASVRPPGSRYAFLSPAKPAAGNRRDAERAFAQGQQLHRADRLAEAMQSYRRATVLDAAYFEAYYGLGLAAFEARSYRQALTAWENALAVQPESADARYNFALTLKAAGYAIDAANELERILLSNPNETRAHLMLGNLYAEQLGNVSRARTHYQKVLELDPRHPQATAIRYWLVAHPS